MENECFENISNVVELGEETENNPKPANKKMKKEETVINDGNFKKSETKSIYLYILYLWQQTKKILFSLLKGIQELRNLLQRSRMKQAQYVNETET